MIFFKKKTQEINWYKAAGQVASYLDHFASGELFELAKPHARFVIDKGGAVHFASSPRNPNHYLGWGDLACYVLAENKEALMAWATAVASGGAFASIETDEFAKKIISNLMHRASK